MNIILNGKPWQFDGQTLADLLQQQALTSPFAVAVNTHFIAKTLYAHTQLHANDQVEIVRPVVGG